MSGSNKKVLAVAIWVVAVAAMVLLKYSPGTAFSSVFRDAKLLKAGDPVTQDGIIIGRVTDVQPAADGGVEVKAKIDKKHLALTHTDSLALIGEAGRTDDQRQLELYPMDTASPPIVKGTRLEGAETRMEMQLRQATARIGPALEGLTREMERTVRSVQDYLNSPEAQKLADDTKRFLRDLKESTDTQISDFRAKHPDFEKQLRQQIEAARKQGNEALLRLLKDLEKRLATSPSSTPGPK
jgi:ABC-type transporter Mla subunit MlaD